MDNSLKSSCNIPLSEKGHPVTSHRLAERGGCCLSIAPPLYCKCCFAVRHFPITNVPVTLAIAISFASGLDAEASSLDVRLTRENPSL
jgi:hypothetical protein